MQTLFIAYILKKWCNYNKKINTIYIFFQVDPVEAVRKNLVPHVCGLGRNQGTSVDSDEKFNNNKDNEDSSGSANVSQLEGSTSNIESQSSVEDEVFLNEENTTLYTSEQDKQDDEVEVNTLFDENHYDTLRDPIYEEINEDISETPPPLPLSPPPPRSIFEGASKYDILNYLVGAKERGIIPEDQTEPEDESSPQHSRINSLDLSSRISHLSNASDSSEDSCNLVISTPDTASISSDKVCDTLLNKYF